MCCVVSRHAMMFVTVLVQHDVVVVTLFQFFETAASFYYLCFRYFCIFYNNVFKYVEWEKKNVCNVAHTHK